MDRYLSQLWAAPSMIKPEGKKLKRKLQKVGTQQQQRPFSVNYTDTKMNTEYKPHKNSLPFNLFSSVKPSAPQQRPSLPHPIGSEEGQWLEDFRKSGYLCRDGRRSRYSESEKNWDRRASLVPEFAHLAVSSEPSTPPLEKPAGPPVKSSHPQTTRRYAKTPVSHIGQLETHPLLRTQDAQETSHDAPTIESIAESYRALLESRASFINDTPVEHSATTEKYGEPFTPQDLSLVPLPLESVTELPEPLPARRSSRSDDGTLVEEESTDMKNTPISPAPSTPSWASYQTASAGLERRRASATDSPDLQICLNLLTKELSKAMSRTPIQPSADTAALQVWFMIEAYEKLRDQIVKTHTGGIQNATLKASLDTWISALHSVHDEMIGADGQRSESDYGD